MYLTHKLASLLGQEILVHVDGASFAGVLIEVEDDYITLQDNAEDEKDCFHLPIAKLMFFKLRNKAAEIRVEEREKKVREEKMSALEVAKNDMLTALRKAQAAEPEDVPH